MRAYTWTFSLIWWEESYPYYLWAPRRLRLCVVSRLTPVLAVMMLFYSTLFLHLSRGPMWNGNVIEFAEYPCDNFWWAGLLHISNYYVSGTLVIEMINLFTCNKIQNKNSFLKLEKHLTRVETKIWNVSLSCVTPHFMVKKRQKVGCSV